MKFPSALWFFSFTLVFQFLLHSNFHRDECCLLTKLKIYFCFSEVLHATFFFVKEAYVLFLRSFVFARRILVISLLYYIKAQINDNRLKYNFRDFIHMYWKHSFSYTNIKLYIEILVCIWNPKRVLFVNYVN